MEQSESQRCGVCVICLQHTAAECMGSDCWGPGWWDSCTQSIRADFRSPRIAKVCGRWMNSMSDIPTRPNHLR